MHRVPLTTPVRLTAATLLAALIVSACGSSAQHKGGQTPYGPKSSPYAMSKCFRANGVSNFPDPSAGPSGSVGFNGVGFGSDGLIVDGTRFSGPAVRSAMKACSEFLPSGPPPKMSEAQKQKVLAFAQCMRTHGVPDFPDPTFNNSGPSSVGPQLDPRSPAFRNAAKQCGGGNGIEIAIPGP